MLRAATLVVKLHHRKKFEFEWSFETNTVVGELAVASG